MHRLPEGVQGQGAGRGARATSGSARPQRGGGAQREGRGHRCSMSLAAGWGVGSGVGARLQGAGGEGRLSLRDRSPIVLEQALRHSSSFESRGGVPYTPQAAAAGGKGCTCARMQQQQQQQQRATVPAPAPAPPAFTPAAGSRAPAAAARGSGCPAASSGCTGRRRCGGAAGRAATTRERASERARVVAVAPRAPPTPPACVTHPRLLEQRLLRLVAVHLHQHISAGVGRGAARLPAASAAARHHAWTSRGRRWGGWRGRRVAGSAAGRSTHTRKRRPCLPATFAAQHAPPALPLACPTQLPPPPAHPSSPPCVSTSCCTCAPACLCPCSPPAPRAAGAAAAASPAASSGPG